MKIKFKGILPDYMKRDKMNNIEDVTWKSLIIAWHILFPIFKPTYNVIPSYTELSQIQRKRIWKYIELPIRRIEKKLPIIGYLFILINSLVKCSMCTSVTR